MLTLTLTCNHVHTQYLTLHLSHTHLFSTHCEPFNFFVWNIWLCPHSISRTHTHSQHTVGPSVALYETHSSAYGHETTYSAAVCITQVIHSKSFDMSFFFSAITPTSSSADQCVVTVASHMLTSILCCWRSRLGQGYTVGAWWSFQILCSFLFHSISLFSLILFIHCGSCHATSGPFWMQSASLANVLLLTVFILLCWGMS